MSKGLHQFVPVLSSRDAIGQHLIRIRDRLRARGVRSEVWAGEVNPDMVAEGRPISEFPTADTGDVLLYHCSTGSTVAEWVGARPETLVLDYHNITPYEMYAPWEPPIAIELMEGRNQLARLASRTTLGLADSAFNELELVGLGYGVTGVAPVLVDVAGLGGVVDEGAVERFEGWAGGGSVWLFVGRVSPNKAQHDVIKAFAVYRRVFDPGARLVLVGGMSSHRYWAALVGLVGSLGLDDAVWLVGSVSDGELGAWYRVADVFVCLSDHEGFCVPLIEAMAHGLPVVAFGSSAVPETLGGAGLVLGEKSSVVVAAGVDRVLSDEGLRSALVGAGRERLGAFDLEVSGAAFLDALAPVLE
ncbi:MAG: glycosyltransferase, partial [Actinomycetia bacterium]|nr:glycosyltransferase [Actinomycetes bacterium]